jgi:murein DD-endopeptidase MepM/ murein hydrolase activator NlpD
VQVYRLRYPVILALTLVPFVAGVYPTRFADAPDFEDYRKMGEVVQGYSRDKETSTYGITLKVRQNVRALADGRVVSMGRLRGYGRYVIVDHGQGWHSLYSNLARLQVAKGENVERGAVMGEARHKRLFLVVSFRGNPINPSEVIGKQVPGQHAARSTVSYTQRI